MASNLFFTTFTSHITCIRNLHSVAHTFVLSQLLDSTPQWLGPHQDWKQEVEYLDNIFKNGAAYTIGRVNGDHWLLYMTTPEEGSGCTIATPTVLDSAGDDQLPDFMVEILMSQRCGGSSLPPRCLLKIHMTMLAYSQTSLEYLRYFLHNSRHIFILPLWLLCKHTHKMGS